MDAAIEKMAKPSPAHSVSVSSPAHEVSAEAFALQHTWAVFARATRSLQAWCHEQSQTLLEQHAQVSRDAAPVVALTWVDREIPSGTAEESSGDDCQVA
jgi:hypothetical protein